MSRSTQPLSELTSGTHLVVILQASILKDEDNHPIVKDGSYGVNVRFNDNKLSMDKVFWTKSSEFNYLCKATDSDKSKPICPELLGKRLWIGVKEVKMMRDDKYVYSNYEICEYANSNNPQMPPIFDIQTEYQQCNNWVSSKELMPITDTHKITGTALADTELDENGNWRFKGKEPVIILEQHGTTYEVIDFPSDKLPDVNVVKAYSHLDMSQLDPIVGKSLVDRLIPVMAEKSIEEYQRLQKLELGRKIIAEGEAKVFTSLNEPNAEKDPFDDLETKIEPAESNDDWDNL